MKRMDLSSFRNWVCVKLWSENMFTGEFIYYFCRQLPADE